MNSTLHRACYRQAERLGRSTASTEECARNGQRPELCRVGGADGGRSRSGTAEKDLRDLRPGRMAWKPGTPLPTTGQRAQEREQFWKILRRRNQEAQQLREQGALGTVAHVNGGLAGGGGRRVLLERILHLVFIRGNSTRERET